MQMKIVHTHFYVTVDLASARCYLIGWVEYSILRMILFLQSALPVPLDKGNKRLAVFHSRSQSPQAFWSAGDSGYDEIGSFQKTSSPGPFRGQVCQKPPNTLEYFVALNMMEGLRFV